MKALKAFIKAEKGLVVQQNAAVPPQAHLDICLQNWGGDERGGPCPHPRAFPGWMWTGPSFSGQKCG